MYELRFSGHSLTGIVEPENRKILNQFAGEKLEANPPRLSATPPEEGI
jgi:hypothetical protein